MAATLASHTPVTSEHYRRLTDQVNRLPTIADLIDERRIADLRTALNEACDFLTAQLLPHMAATERAVYGELERMFQNRHSMTPMRREHETIRAEVDRLVSYERTLRDQPCTVRQQIALRRAIFRLYGLLRVHLAEELLYAEIVEHGASVEAERDLAAAMEHAGTTPL